MADLATLNVRIEAQDAIRQTKAYDAAAEKAGRSVDAMERATIEAEIAVRRIAQAERDAQRESRRMEAAARDVAREMNRQQAAIVQAEMATRRIAAAERAAYIEAERLATAQAKVTTASKLMAAATRLATVAAIAYVGARMVNAMTDLADTAKVLEGRLKLVATSEENLRMLQDRLAESAKRTRSSLESTITLYSRVARNADQLGFSQQDLLRFTELTQMAIKSSGATAQEAAAGVIQLSQALASGTLRGDEFRSVAEQLPGLARALVQGMGVEGVGALRKLAFEGNLTAEQVIEAVLRMDTTIRGDFTQAPKLVAEGWQALRDEVMLTFAAIDNGAGGGTSALAQMLQNIADNIQRIRSGGAGNPLEGLFMPAGFSSAQGRGGVVAPSFPAIAPIAAAAKEAEAAVQDLRTEEEKARDERRKEWELARARAAEKKRWDDAEVVRLHEIAEAAHRANVARLGGSLTMGAGSTTVARGSIGAPVMSLPAGFGAGSSLMTGLDPSAFARAMMRANEDIAKNFRENIQRSIGRFFSDFLTEGGNAVRNLFSGLKSMGADLIGQTLSKAIMPKFDNLGFGQSLAVGAGLGILGSVVESFFSAGDAARAMAMAMAESARNIEQYARFATDRNLTPEQRAIRDQQDARDSLARRAVAAAGIHGFTGGLDEAQAFLQNDVWRTILGPRFDELVEQLETLDEAYAANADAAREAAREMERAAALQRIEALDRTVAGLEGFQTSLGMSNLSTLNPFQQLDLAKTEYNRILQRAMSGDQDAAGQLPAAARAFLEQSRGVNASGARFASDFDRVNADTERVLALFEGQRTREQEALDVATNTLEVTQAIGTTLDTHTEIFGKGFGGIIERLDRTITRLDEVERGIRVGNEQRAA